MNENERLKKAHYLLITSKFIRSHFLRVHAERLKKELPDSKRHELTVTQHFAVMMIDENGPLTIKALAELLGISPPSASSMVDKLVSKGILNRRQSQKDRRKVRVSISPAASKVIDSANRTTIGIYADLLEKAGPETTRKWCDVLEHLKRIIEEDTPATWPTPADT